jgi:3-dehydroquinate dehydratase
VSVLADVVLGRVSGQGVDGYRTALEQLKGALA